MPIRNIWDDARREEHPLMRNLPTGTVTLLFTDMEGSTRLLQQLGERYIGVLADCRQLLRTAFIQYNGHEVDTQGDAFFVVFARATDAAAAAVAIQRALYAAAEMAWILDNTKLTETLCAEGLALFRTLGDTAGMANALELFGTSAWARGQYALARPQVEEAATLFRQLGDSWKQGRCLTQLARIATVQGDYDQAHRLLEQSLAIYKALGDKERIGWVLYLQAKLLFLSQRDIAQARNLTEQSLALLQEIDSPWARAYSLVLLGQIMLEQEEQAQARDLSATASSTTEAILVTEVFLGKERRTRMPACGGGNNVRFR
jgi:tetratricopeptide (TPR) repeat protein